MRLVAPLMVILMLSVGLLLAGWSHAERQREAVGYEPTPAKVVSSGVTRQPLGGYAPRVVFQYRQGERSFEARRYTPLGAGGSLSWAQREAERFVAGEATTAYVDPRQPSRAVLVLEARFYPYLLILAPAVALGLALAGLLRCGFFEAPPRAETRGPYDWYHIPASQVAATRGVLTGGFVALWYVYGTLVLGHYLTVASSMASHLGPGVVFGVYALAGVPVARSVLRRGRLGRLLADASLSATLPSFRTDGLVNLKLAQRVRADAQITEATLSLVCEQRRGLFTSERMFTNSAELTSGVALRPGQQLVGECCFEIPPRKRRPSSPFSRWRYPRTDWLVELKIRMADGGRYRVTYPVRVEGHAASASAQAA